MTEVGLAVAFHCARNCRITVLKYIAGYFGDTVYRSVDVNIVGRRQPHRRCLSLRSCPDRRFHSWRSHQALRSVTRRTAPMMIRRVLSDRSLNVRSTHCIRASRPSVLAGTPATTSTASTDTVSPASRCTASVPLTIKSRTATISLTQKAGSYCCRSPSRAPASNRNCFHRTPSQALNKLTTTTTTKWRTRDAHLP